MFSRSIRDGIAYLTSQQQVDGSFLSFSSTMAEDFTNAKVYHSPFPASLILSCLNNFDKTSQTQAIKEKIIPFLLSQKNLHWSYNYWTRNSGESKKMPYPDDLDDTFCALSALFQFDKRTFDGTAMAKIVLLLTASEIKEGGPYRTWLVEENVPEVWKDVDIAVNSNIAYFLSLQEIELPNLIQFVEKAINSKKLKSPYYYSEVPIIYFISRYYKGKHVIDLKELLFSKRQKNGSWENPLHTALAVSALLNFGASPKDLVGDVDNLINIQKQGHWESYAFYIDPTVGVEKHYAGSPALTTAFCLEALGKYLKLTKEISIKKEKKLQKSKSDISEKLHEQIIENVRQIFSTVFPELTVPAETMLNAIIKTDIKKQITLLPYFVKLSLGDSGMQVPESLLIELGTASLLGWIAYTIFDDFLDEEGPAEYLSVATLSLRKLTSFFSEVLPENREFKSFFHTIMDELDAVNAWEVTHCRIKNHKKSIHLETLNLPDYGNYEVLAKRSLGHAIAPIAVLYYLGYSKNSPEVINLLLFFKHYIIARQLNDDAHDFEKDLKMGHINAVGALLLNKFKLKHDNEKRTIDLKTLIPAINELFWDEIIEIVCTEIQKHTNLARKALKNITLIQDRSYFENILLLSEKSAQHALEEREKMFDFLQTYQ